MINLFTYFLFIFFVIQALAIPSAEAQAILDSNGKRIELGKPEEQKKDSLSQIHSPRKAAIRSAIIPGWGQAYNKKYWKIPLVYGAIGTAAGVFVYNVKYYRDFRFAYNAKYKASLPPGQRDTTDLARIRPNLAPLDQETLRYQRNEFRRSVDYSILAFILLWGLNVVDATVDAHFKSFDVSPDLALKLKGGKSQLAGTNGVSLVLVFK